MHVNGAYSIHVQIVHVQSFWFASYTECAHFPRATFLLRKQARNKRKNSRFFSDFSIFLFWNLEYYFVHQSIGQGLPLVSALAVLPVSNTAFCLGLHCLIISRGRYPKNDNVLINDI